MKRVTADFAELVKSKIGEYDTSELHLGIAGHIKMGSLPFTAPWMSPFGACLITITDIKRNEDGEVMFQLGDEDKIPYDDGMAWCLANEFYSEWPQ